MSFTMFDQLQKHAVSRGGMYESDPCIVRSHARRGVDESRTGGFESRERFFDVFDANGDVVNTLTAFCHEFYKRRIRSDWLEQFNPAVAHGQHGYTDALIINLVEPRYFQSNHVFVNFDGILKRLYGYSDVVNLHAT